MEQPNLLTPNTSAAAGLSRYPFSNPFLPGGNWLPAGGVLTATGLPQLHPSMFPLDPNSPFKHFNPALLSYHYPFPVTQTLKTFSSQASVSPLSGTGNPTQVTSGVVYPITPNPNLSAFHSINETSSIGTTGNSITPPIYQVPPPQAFSGIIPQVLTGMKDKQESSVEKIQGLNWMKNPLMGSSFNMVPYLVGQTQLGIGAGGVGVHGNQPVNLFNSPLPSGTPTGSEGNLTKLGAHKDNALVSHNIQQHCRGSSTIDFVRDSIHRQGEISPSHTPPLGVTGVKKPQYALVPEGSKWKSVEQNAPQIVFPPYSLQKPVVTSSPFSTSAVPGHMFSNSGHVIPMGFPSVVGTNAPGSLPSKSRGEGVGHGNARAPHDKMKLRIHQVRNDDFKMQAKPDRRRKRWRGGRDKDVGFSTRAELAESAVRRMGFINEPMKDTPIPALPASLAVEPSSQGTTANTARHGEAPPVNSDGNYALNMLADMSSIQCKEEHAHNEEVPDNYSTTSAALEITSSTVNSNLKQPLLRSPVSLAARSLLMLGEDLNIREKSHDSKNRSHDSENKSHDVTHVENTAATSLLQLSGAMLSNKDQDHTKHTDVPHHDHVGGGQLERSKSSYDIQGRSTRSASFSAAEAMIMMGTGSESEETNSEQVFENPQNARSPHPPSLGDIDPFTMSQPLREIKKPRSLVIDSEATDTDSEATLTPSPTPKKTNTFIPPLFAMDENAKDHSLPGVGSESSERDVSKEDSLDTFNNKLVVDNFVKDMTSESKSSPVLNRDDSIVSESSQCPPDWRRDSEYGITDSLIEPAIDHKNINGIGPEGVVPLTGQEKKEEQNLPINDTSVELDLPTPLHVFAPGKPETLGHPRGDSPTLSSNSTPERDLPPAKRPKFISTFGPAAGSDESHSNMKVLLNNDNSAGNDTNVTPVDPKSPPTTGSITMQSAMVNTSPTNVFDQNDETLPSLNAAYLGDISSPRNVEETELTDKIDKEGADESASHSSDDTKSREKYMEEMSAKCYITEGEPALFQPKESEIIDKEKLVSDDHGSNSLFAGNEECVHGGSTSPGSHKIKVSKTRKDGVSSNDKGKNSHGKGKTRIIKIRRAKSPKLSKNPPPYKPALVSWSTFSDAAIKEDEAAMKSIQTSQPSNETQLSNEENQMKKGEDILPEESDIESSQIPPHLSDTLESSLDLEVPSLKPLSDLSPTSVEACGSGAGNTNLPIAPQNRLKVSGTDALNHHSHSSKLRNQKNDKTQNKKNLSLLKPLQERKGRSLFDVDSPKQHSPSPKGDSKREHCGLDKKSAGSPRPRKAKSLQVAPRDLSGNKSQNWHSNNQGTLVPPADHSQTTTNRNRQKEFSPLSDEDVMRSSPLLRYPSSKDSHSTKWSDDEEHTKHRIHRRHRGSVDSPSLPSPSSLSSFSLKKHHHRHHRDRSLVGGGTLGNEDQFPSKHDRRIDKSISRGSSPDRKRNHHHHRHRRHSYEGRTHNEVYPVPQYSTVSSKVDIRKRSYESISDDDMFDSAEMDEESLNRRSLHEGGVPLSGGGVKRGTRKRRHVSSEESLDDESDPISSVSSPLMYSRHSSSLPSKRKKAKHGKDHKERWKEGSGKHKHSHKH